MYSALPAQIITIENAVAEADVQGNRMRVDTSLLPEVQAGDHVLVQAGFVISLITPEDFEAQQKIFHEITNNVRKALDA